MTRRNVLPLSLSVGTLVTLALSCAPVDPCTDADGRDTCVPPSSSSSSSGSTSSSGGPVCAAVMCELGCEFGFAADKDGCPTCRCLPSPTDCAGLTDEASCRDTQGCVVVFFEGDEGGGWRATPAASESFQCCTVDGDAVRCDGEPVQCYGAWLDENGTCRSPNDGVYPAFCCEPPPPVEVCATDSDCSFGQVCDTVNYCESPCTGDDNTACIAVCYGRCVTQDCRATGCEQGSACTEMFVDCAAPADENGDGYGDCAGGSQWVCVPSADDCRTWGCEEGSVCQEVLTNCGGVSTDGGADDPTSNCGFAPVYACVGDPCLAADCGPGTTCVACAPNMDCVIQCVPVVEDCRFLGCAEGEVCEARPTNCVEPDREDGGVATPTNCGDEPVFVCVAAPADCRSAGCDVGFACQEVGMLCADGSSSEDGGTPPALCGESLWACVAVDPCAGLTEEQCPQMNSHQCVPVYATTCPRCGNDPAPCTEEYVGCQSAGE